MAGMLSFDSLAEAVTHGEIDTVIAAQTDMQGRLMGKRFHADYFIDSAHKETHSCNYLLATDMEMDTVEGFQSTSWAAGYGDYVMKPDLSTLRRIPWLEGTALVLCDVFDHHGKHEIAHAPRTMLKKQLQRLEKHSYRAMMASELEFFLFREDYDDIRFQGFDELTPYSAYNEDYHIFQTTKEEDVMREIRNGLNEAGIPVENSKGEADAGQVEINVRYADALVMADRHSIMKNGIKEIAYDQGRAITFMAKWSSKFAGNSSHLHQSLTTMDGFPIFYDAQQPHSMSKIMQHYLAGLLHYSKDITLMLAPNINSYKRFSAGTFAPTKAVWSMDNRTAGYRICGADTRSVRVECRIGGADLNPYIAYSAMLAAGLKGIEDKLELPPIFQGDAYTADGIPEIPATLREAIDAFSNSAMLRAALGDDVVDHYTHAACHEQAQFDRAVTNWEQKRYFERG